MDVVERWGVGVDVPNIDSRLVDLFDTSGFRWSLDEFGYFFVWFLVFFWGEGSKTVAFLRVNKMI